MVNINSCNLHAQRFLEVLKNFLEQKFENCLCISPWITPLSRSALSEWECYLGLPRGARSACEHHPFWQQGGKWCFSLQAGSNRKLPKAGFRKLLKKLFKKLFIFVYTFVWVVRGCLPKGINMLWGEDIMTYFNSHIPLLIPHWE